MGWGMKSTYTFTSPPCFGFVKSICLYMNIIPKTLNSIFYNHNQAESHPVIKNQELQEGTYSHSTSNMSFSRGSSVEQDGESFHDSPITPQSPVPKDEFKTTSSLEGLQTEEQQRVLDTVAHLRKCGLESILPLPQLVVCGDQSAGKSEYPKFVIIR